MKILVTGSAGHLGQAVMRTLAATGHEAFGADVLRSPHTQRVGSITDRAFARECVSHADAVLHVATLHKPTWPRTRLSSSWTPTSPARSTCWKRPLP